MASYRNQNQSANSNSVLADELPGFTRKIPLMMLKVIKKPFLNSSSAKPKLDLFSDTVYNGRFYSFCKEEKKRRIEELCRPVELW